MWRNQHVRLDLLGMVLSVEAQRRVDRVSAAVGLVVSDTPSSSASCCAAFLVSGCE